MLGCRDGLVLVTFGLSLSLLIQRRWRWAIAGAGLSVAWMLLLSRWSYPVFWNGEGPKAAGRMFSHLGDNLGDILFTLISKPWLAFTHIDLGGGAFYLLLLILPTLPFWRQRSLIILNVLERRLPGGWGVVLDDLAAGAMAGMILTLALLVIGPA